MRLHSRAVGGLLIGALFVVAAIDVCLAQDTMRAPWLGSPAEQGPAAGWRAARSTGRATQAQATVPMAWPASARTTPAPSPVPLIAQQPQAPAAPAAPAAPVAPPAASGPDMGMDAFDDLNVAPPPAQPMPQGRTVQPTPTPSQAGPQVQGPGYAPGYAPGYPGGSAMAGSSFDCGSDGCTCGEMCDGACGGPGCWGPGAYWGPNPFGWLRDLSLFAGAHGFKGPVDGGQNGNFGIHEGLNWSSPLGDPWGMGFQLGMQGVHSNFQGYSMRVVQGQVGGAPVGDVPLDVPGGGVQTMSFVVPNGDRDQVFFTAGLFRRAVEGGIQWGVAFDLMHDSYYYTADLKQIRTEVSAVWPGWREIGFWGAFSVGNERVQERFTYRFQGIPIDIPVDQDYTLEPTDQFNFFYRQYFRNGGEGRIWLGFTSNSDFLLGGDLWMPLSTRWAIENSFNFLVPKETGEAKQREQSWSVMVQLVWYPGRTARASRNNPFRPVFNVADNSVFMVDRLDH